MMIEQIIKLRHSVCKKKSAVVCSVVYPVSGKGLALYS